MTSQNESSPLSRLPGSRDPNTLGSGPSSSHQYDADRRSTSGDVRPIYEAACLEALDGFRSGKISRVTACTRVGIAALEGAITEPSEEKGVFERCFPHVDRIDNKLPHSLARCQKKLALAMGVRDETLTEGETVADKSSGRENGGDDATESDLSPPILSRLTDHPIQQLISRVITPEHMDVDPNESNSTSATSSGPAGREGRSPSTQAFDVPTAL